jgi:chloramphenicol-sensitive protein RarD
VRSGVLFGIGAYGLWGLFPLFFEQLGPATPLEILAHRIVWSLVVVVGLLAATARLRSIRATVADPRTRLLLAGAAVLIAGNWGVYIYAVNAGRVLEAALGYFITPLVSAVFGVLIFGERLRGTQVLALALGTVAVVVLAVASAGVPWIALFLAASFGSYGLLKKLAGVGAAEGLAVETIVLAGPALLFLAVLGGTGHATFTSEGAGHGLLLVAAGPITALPLLLFAACVTRVPLTTVGLLQYVTPVMQFLIGWLVEGEALPLSRWIGFALVWVALVILTWDGLRSGLRGRAAAVPGSSTIAV